ncbi:hypothetical protein SDJN02_01258, partial [Cucurbita argyrosperma subsp. argyrosperma]
MKTYATPVSSGFNGARQVRHEDILQEFIVKECESLEAYLINSFLISIPQFIDIKNCLITNFTTDNNRLKA